VLVAGGGSASAELYDPTTRRFSPTGSMSVARTDATATLLPDGEVLVAGGELSSGEQTASADLYDASSGTFTATTPMSTARSGQTATVLPDGDVLVAGGGCNPGQGGDCDSGSSLVNLRSAELYDPGTATWSATASMTVGRQYFTATSMPDGRVLVTGGFNSCDDDFCKDTASTEIYDPDSGKWSPTGRLLNPRESHTATLLENGDVLVAGGTIENGDMGRSTPLKDAEVYEPTTGRWTAAPSMLQAHTGASAVLLSNGWVLVAGGGTPIAEVYQPDRSAWVATGALSTARTDGTATVLADGDVLATGGGVSTAETYQTGKGPLVTVTPRSLRFGGVEVGSRSRSHSFTVTNLGDGALHVAGVGISGTDPGDFSASDDCPIALAPLGSCSVSVTFAPLSTGARSATVQVVDDAPGSPQTAQVSGYGAGPNAWAPTGAMSTARVWFAMTSLGGGRVLVAGGATPTLVPLASAQVYDAKTGRFTATGSMSSDRVNVMATRLDDGRVLVAGGRDANFVAQSSAEIYDPQAGTWTTTTPMNAAGYGLTQTLLNSGKVLVTGLGTEGLDAEVYDPGTASWTDTKPMICPGQFAAATLLTDGRVLVAGCGSTATEIYHPRTNSWTPAAPLNTARDSAQAVLLDDGDVLLAGGADPDGGAALDTSELYDPSANSWTYTNNRMEFPSVSFTLTLLSNGNVLAAGGCGASGCDGPAQSSSEYYDHAYGFWEPNPSMVHARSNAQAVTLPSGDLLVVGGDSGFSGPREAETFTPTLVSVTPTSGPAGTRIVIRGNGFQAGETVQVQWNWVDWHQLRVGPLGRFTLRAKVPQDPPGQYAIYAHGKQSSAYAACLFTVTSGQAAAP
jgi:N-acetylneuraminic acid mutarotase